MKHRHPVAQIERLLLLVGDEHGRDPDPFDERPQLAPRALPQARVQVRERLVPKQHPRPRGPGTPHRPPPPPPPPKLPPAPPPRYGKHTPEIHSPCKIVCPLLL